MTALLDIFLILHFIGLAAVIGSFLTQMRRKSGFSTFWIIAGLITQLVTGIAMMGILEAKDHSDVNEAKLGIKLVLAIIALVLAFVAQARQRKATAGSAPAKAALPFFHTAGALAIVNVLIAVIWQ